MSEDQTTKETPAAYRHKDTVVDANDEHRVGDKSFRPQQINKHENRSVRCIVQNSLTCNAHLSRIKRRLAFVFDGKFHYVTYNYLPIRPIYIQAAYLVAKAFQTSIRQHNTYKFQATLLGVTKKYHFPEGAVKS